MRAKDSMMKTNEKKEKKIIPFVVVAFGVLCRRKERVHANTHSVCMRARASAFCAHPCRVTETDAGLNERMIEEESVCVRRA